MKMIAAMCGHSFDFHVNYCFVFIQFKKSTTFYKVFIHCIICNRSFTFSFLFSSFNYSYLHENSRDGEGIAVCTHITTWIMRKIIKLIVRNIIKANLSKRCLGGNGSTAQQLLRNKITLAKFIERWIPSDYTQRTTYVSQS